LLLGLFLMLWQVLLIAAVVLCIWLHVPLWIYFIWVIPYIAVAIFATFRFDRVIAAVPPATEDSHVLSTDA